VSEERGKHEVDRPGGLPPGTLLRYADPEYQAPTPQDVRTLKTISGMTGRELCALVGMEDHRTWRRWSQEPDQAGHRQIPYAAWRLLVLELGLVRHRSTGVKASPEDG
tara:strand:+ start:1418 stop:1741 length:324 start_codon:yes stop_codon:yes gene_type:complete